jgi:hypothetical protein
MPCDPALSETNSSPLLACAAEAEGGSPDTARLKTKVRRLYDIANILSSLRLLEKTQQPDSRKPAFRWLGSEARLAAAPAATLKSFFRRAHVPACARCMPAHACMPLPCPHARPGRTHAAAANPARLAVALPARTPCMHSYMLLPACR